MVSERTSPAPGGMRLHAVKWAKYTSASLAGAIVGQSALFVTTAVLDWRAWIGNLAAAAVGAVPNYLINRYWTWNKRGRNHIRREVLPFWILTLAGTALSTLFVAIVAAWWDSQLLIQVAQLAGYGCLWVVKFFVLEHMLFGPSTHEQVDDVGPTAPLD